MSQKGGMGGVFRSYYPKQPMYVQQFEMLAQLYMIHDDSKFAQIVRLITKTLPES